MPPEGAHINFLARASDNQTYYCKSDTFDIAVRMREAVYSRLAWHLGIPTPNFVEIFDDQTGESFFGSKRHVSTSLSIERKRFLRTERRDDRNQPLPFPGRMLSQLYALDMFIYNEDRSADNIIFHSEGANGRRLCPIDFALSSLSGRAVNEFPVESTETVQVGKRLRLVHGTFIDSALELVDRIDSMPADIFSGFFADLPIEWTNVAEREWLHAFWNGPNKSKRLENLRSGLRDGHLL